MAVSLRLSPVTIIGLFLIVNFGSLGSTVATQFLRSSFLHVAVPTSTSLPCVRRSLGSVCSRSLAYQFCRRDTYISSIAHCFEPSHRMLITSYCAPINIFSIRISWGDGMCVAYERRESGPSQGVRENYGY
ncbi:hypothetical protein BD414DRAFT_204809 [Trametes punicea]|nr:hypothetical protein BD414DRAFT_204809 [Trametes punicea]